MTRTQVLYFIEVAKTESFSRAAEALFVSHQVLSSQIKALERELDLVLIDRSNRRKIRLTDAGRVMFDAWSDMEEIFVRAEHQARKLQEAAQNSLVIGIQDMRFVRSYVVPLIRKMQDSPAKVNLEYRLGSPVEMFHMLEAGQVDMLIVISSDDDPEMPYRRMVLCEDALHLVAAVSKHHPLAKRKKLKLADLKDETILMVGAEYSDFAKRSFQKDLELAHLKNAHVKNLQGPHAINIAVTTGMGVALIFDELLEEDRDEIKTFPMGLTNAVKVDMNLVWKEERLDGIAKQMVELL